MDDVMEAYPVRVDIVYPDRQLNRVSTLFRPFAALPILLIICLVAGSTSAAAGGGIIAVPTALMIVARHKYPRWWFDFNRELVRFGARVFAYVALLDDTYPSTDEQQSVTVDLPYPDVERDLTPWLALVKWLLALPHYLVLALLWIGGLFTIVFAWFAILVTGRYPRWAFDYIVGLLRWELRVTGYAFLLVTDRYPPFSLR